MARSDPAGRTIATHNARLLLSDFERFAVLADARAARGRNVLLALGDMVQAAAGMIALDGLAKRLILAPPGASVETLQALARDGDADAILCGEAEVARDLGLPLVSFSKPGRPAAPEDAPSRSTEWALATSGTNGPPKLVLHDLATLAGALTAPPRQEWATFYDIRRYGGLQVFLRALAGSGSLTLTNPDEPPESFLDRNAAAGVTHISGTPSHWRRALMSGAAGRISPAYVRLSGEIADQAVLDALARAFPDARIEHAYASTEAGVGFVVSDGRAGFPAALLASASPVAMRVENGVLHVRSPGAAYRYLGAAVPLRGADGFVDTGDMVERVDDRFLFAGRRGGIINVGGAKVHPEEIERVINAQPGVRASLVKGRRSPIMGAIVVAEVVAVDGVATDDDFKKTLLAACRRDLPGHKVPASLRFVPALPLTDGGKLARHG